MTFIFGEFIKSMKEIEREKCVLNEDFLYKVRITIGALYLIEMMYLKKIIDDTEELDVFDEGSDLFALKNWTFKATPMNRAFFLSTDR